MSLFHKLFPRKPVIGMLHLRGRYPIDQALQDLKIYEQEGLDGVIIENYDGTEQTLISVLSQIQSRDAKLKLGINFLGNFKRSFELAGDYNADFIQIDSVQLQDIDLNVYDRFRGLYLNTVVLGGVGFKYTSNPGDNLQEWLELAKSRVDAVVATGLGIGQETPIKKLEHYKTLLGDFPLIEGAGSTRDNVYEHLMVSDGVIVESYFNPDGNTELPVDEFKVRKYMPEANRARPI
ncbi:hypothetical protein HYT56_03060 [Candidatus Woesearchaeota archaeon]|nr:hypothetical protein [Candidatus Woesearchaeota archaeon]